MTEPVLPSPPRVCLAAPAAPGRQAVALAVLRRLRRLGGDRAARGCRGRPGGGRARGSRKTVQHLEGGIVRGILVQDGSQVVAGQPLIELDATRARAEHAALLAEWRALSAGEARLLAEQAGAAAVAFPDGPRRGRRARIRRSPGCWPARADRLASRRAALADQQAVLAERIAQAEAEISGLEAQIASGAAPARADRRGGRDRRQSSWRRASSASRGFCAGADPGRDRWHDRLRPGRRSPAPGR